jgi:hypothetical protein
MPERLKYAHLFSGNPFEGKDYGEVFSLLHWGNQYNHMIPIDAPEPLIMLGMMARFQLDGGQELHFDDGEAFIAVGHASNRIYVVPRKYNRPVNVPKFTVGLARVGRVKRTDYLSTKGGAREHYYYHDHEEPLPTLYTHPTGVGYVRPAKHNGGPSYAVGKEGIVG